MCGFGSDGAAALLSACPLVRCCSHQFVLRCCFRALLNFVRSAARPSHAGRSVNVDSLHISYAYIFISQARAAGGSPPQCQLTVEDVFWNAATLHTADMTQTSQSGLSKRSVHTAASREGRQGRQSLGAPE